MLNVIAPAIILLASSAAADTAAPETTAAERLTSHQIETLMVAGQDVTPNCTVVGDPCIYIICGTPTQPGDWPRGLYACQVD